MQLDYIDKINEFGDNIVRLYDFDRSQADKFRLIVTQTIIVEKKQLDLSTVDFIQARNCNLVLRISDEENGIVRSNKIQFYCDYYNEHNPPHFHAKYGEFKVKIDINTLQVLKGELPKRAKSLVMEWADEHRDELQQDWELARHKQEIDEFGGIAWENGFDFCPNYLRELTDKSLN